MPIGLGNNEGTINVGYGESGDRKAIKTLRSEAYATIGILVAGLKAAGSSDLLIKSGVIEAAQSHLIQINSINKLQGSTEQTEEQNTQEQNTQGYLCIMADNIGKAETLQHEEHAPPPTPQVSELKGGIVVDTVHNDEAMKVIANYDGQEDWDEAEEKRLRKKIDRRLLPILCVTYALQYYDKGMRFPICLYYLF